MDSNRAHMPLVPLCLNLFNANHFARSDLSGGNWYLLDQPSMAEHRSDQRQRTYKGGRINAKGFPGTDCLIRNLSDKGARLEIDSALVTVDEFDLVILPEYLNRKCRVAWRKPKSIGVRFV